MSDITKKRCRALKQLRTHAGIVDAMAKGTVVREVDSLGRTLLLVQWDNGITVNVFPDEIIFVEDLVSRAGEEKP